MKGGAFFVAAALRCRFARRLLFVACCLELLLFAQRRPSPLQPLCPLLARSSLSARPAHPRQPQQHNNKTKTKPKTQKTNEKKVLREIEAATKAFPDAYIRMAAFDAVRQVQVASMLVHRPASATDYRKPDQRQV